MLATAGPYRYKKQKKENQKKNLCLNIKIKRTPYDPRSHKRYRPVHLFYITSPDDIFLTYSETVSDI